MARFSFEKARNSAKKVNETIEAKVILDPEAREFYERKLHEIELALLMRETREKVNLSQEIVAARMKTTKSAVSRLESCGSSRRHSPSIETLLKYAQALGHKLKIELIPEKKPRPRV